MDADLTCPTCQGRGVYGLGEWECPVCDGAGRCRPTLAEWDALRAERNELDGIVSAYHDATGCLPEDASALRAERDRYRDALERIDGLPYMPHGQAEVDARQIARAALDAKDCTCSTRTVTDDGRLVHADTCPRT